MKLKPISSKEAETENQLHVTTSGSMNAFRYFNNFYKDDFAMHKFC